MQRQEYLTSFRLLAGRILSVLVVLFLVVDGSTKFMDLAPVREAFGQLGYPLVYAPVIGAICLASALLYAVPRTAALGAVLVTALCGGAVASQLRIGSPLFTHVLFGAYVGVLAWLGLLLRDERVRGLFAARG